MTINIPNYSREELIKKLDASKNKDGFFTVSKKSSVVSSEDDNSKLSKQEKIDRAVKEFANSLDKKPIIIIKSFSL